MKATAATALAIAVFLSTSIAAMAQKQGAAPEAEWSMYGGVDESSLPSSNAVRPNQAIQQKYLAENAARRQAHIDGYKKQYEERLAAETQNRSAATQQQHAATRMMPRTTAHAPVQVAAAPRAPGGAPAFGSTADHARFYKPKLGYPYTED